MTTQDKEKTGKNKKEIVEEKEDTTQAVTAKRATLEEPIHIYKRWCKACGICVAFCPKNVLAFGEDGMPYVAHPENCTQCGLCDIRCPDFAITGSSRWKKH